MHVLKASPFRASSAEPVPQLAAVTATTATQTHLRILPPHCPTAMVGPKKSTDAYAGGTHEAQIREQLEGSRPRAYRRSP